VATHWYWEDAGDPTQWMKLCADKWYFWADGDWVRWTPSNRSKEKMVPCPTEQPVEPTWNGEGLPPCGVNACTSGGECVVIGVDENKGEVAVQWNDGELGVVPSSVVRPIRTKEQRVKAELAELIESHGSMSAGVIAESIVEHYQKLLED